MRRYKTVNIFMHTFFLDQSIYVHTDTHTDTHTYIYIYIYIYIVHNKYITINFINIFLMERYAIKMDIIRYCLLPNSTALKYFFRGEFDPHWVPSTYDLIPY